MEATGTSAIIDKNWSMPKLILSLSSKRIFLFWQKLTRVRCLPRNNSWWEELTWAEGKHQASRVLHCTKLVGYSTQIWGQLLLSIFLVK